MASGTCCGGLTAGAPPLHRVRSKACHSKNNVAGASLSEGFVWRAAAPNARRSGSIASQHRLFNSNHSFLLSEPQNAGALHLLGSKQGSRLWPLPSTAPSQLTTQAIEVSADITLSTEQPSLESEPAEQSDLGSELDVAEVASGPPHEPFADYIADAVERLRPQFEQVDRTVAVNLRRVLDAYREARVGSHHLTGSTGYGHNDVGGREALDT